MTTPLLVPAVRRAGAEARAVLLQMAAERLNAPVERLQVKAGTITDSGKPGGAVTYAQLVAGKRIERHLTNVAVKPVAAFQIIGKSPHRKDGLEKVTGPAKYSGDFVFAGMLHASILRPPAHGAKLKSADTSAAEKIPGVQVVKDVGMIAVLHERPDVAAQALETVKAEFENPPAGADDKTIFDNMQKVAPQPRVVAQDRAATWRKASASPPVPSSSRPISTATSRTPPWRPIRPPPVLKTARYRGGPVRRRRSR